MISLMDQSRRAQLLGASHHHPRQGAMLRAPQPRRPLLKEQGFALYTRVVRRCQYSTTGLWRASSGLSLVEGAPDGPASALFRYRRVGHEYPDIAYGSLRSSCLYSSATPPNLRGAQGFIWTGASCARMVLQRTVSGGTRTARIKP